MVKPKQGKTKLHREQVVINLDLDMGRVLLRALHNGLTKFVNGTIAIQ